MLFNIIKSQFKEHQNINLQRFKQFVMVCILVSDSIKKFDGTMFKIRQFWRYFLEKDFVEPKKEENFKSLKFRAILEQYNRSLVLVL